MPFLVFWPLESPKWIALEDLRDGGGSSYWKVQTAVTLIGVAYKADSRLGILTVVIGAAIPFLLPDSPASASFLSQDEKNFINHQLAHDSGTASGAIGTNEKFQWSYIRAALSDWKIYLGVLMYWGHSIGTCFKYSQAVFNKSNRFASTHSASRYLRLLKSSVMFAIIRIKRSSNSSADRLLGGKRSASHRPCIFHWRHNHSHFILVCRQTSDTVAIHRWSIFSLMCWLHWAAGYSSPRLPWTNLRHVVLHHCWFVPGYYWSHFLDCKQPCNLMEASRRHGIPHDVRQPGWSSWYVLPCKDCRMPANRPLQAPTFFLGDRHQIIDLDTDSLLLWLSLQSLRH